MKHHKIVLMPISVPVGDYCWDLDKKICLHFSNRGGHPSCSLYFFPGKEDKEGRILKAKECRELRKKE